MTEGEVSPDLQSSHPEKEVKYDRRVLAESGDLITLSGKEIVNTSRPMSLLLGSERPQEAETSKKYDLSYPNKYSDTDADGSKQARWMVADTDSLGNG